jgi:methylene-fatty-acyl-phospholipid synthase
VSPALVGAAAALLGLERIAYVLVWHFPDRFCGWARRPLVARLGEAVDVLAILFVAFKVLQLGVFIAWCVIVSRGSVWPCSPDGRVLAAGLLAIAFGQALNLSVFNSLGKTGVFYGNKLGHTIGWRESFPFTWFDHPQYVGTVLSIWGFFLLMRFPASDWPVIPLIETAYYVIGAHLERDRRDDRQLDEDQDALGI